MFRWGLSSMQGHFEISFLENFVVVELLELVWFRRDLYRVDTQEIWSFDVRMVVQRLGKNPSGQHVGNVNLCGYIMPILNLGCLLDLFKPLSNKDFVSCRSVPDEIQNGGRIDPVVALVAGDVQFALNEV